MKKEAIFHLKSGPQTKFSWIIIKYQSNYNICITSKKYNNNLRAQNIMQTAYLAHVSGCL